MKKVLFVILLIACVATSIFFYKKHVAFGKMNNYIQQHNISKNEVKETYKGWDWTQSGLFVLQFELKHDNPKHTYILATNGKKKGKVFLEKVSITGENISHPKLKKLRP